MSHAKWCADKGVANEGWDPKNRQPRSDRLGICRSVTHYKKLTWHLHGRGALRYNKRSVLRVQSEEECLHEKN